jgi:hypothetical protein
MLSFACLEIKTTGSSEPLLTNVKPSQSTTTAMDQGLSV